MTPEKIIKLFLFTIIILAILSIWILPKTRLVTRLQNPKRFYILTHWIGLVCALAGFFILLKLPDMVTAYHLWELLTLPYALFNFFWLAILKSKREMTFIDKQDIDISHAGTYSLVVVLLTSGIVYIPMMQRNLLPLALLFPYLLFTAVLVYSVVSLFSLK